MTEYLTTTTEAARSNGSSPTRSAGGSWSVVESVVSAVAGTRRDQFTSASEDDWLEEMCGQQANPRHRLEGEEKSLENVAGQVLGGQSAMQDGSFGTSRARKTQP